MEIQTIFNLAKQKNIEDLQIKITTSKSVSISLYDHRIDKYEINDNVNLIAKGIYNGHMATVATEKLDKTTPKFIVDNIIKNARVINSKDEVIIYEGSKEYGSLDHIYNKDLENISLETKINKLYSIYKKAEISDSTIKDIASVFYSEEENYTDIYNSKGLHLSEKRNVFVCGLEVIKQQFGMSEIGYYSLIDNDFSKIDVDKIVTKAINDVNSRLGGTPCKTGNYDIVLDSEVATSLLKVLVSGLSAEEINKNRSYLKGKLNEKVFGENITIIEDPLNKDSLVSRTFDSECVATKRKTLIENGIVKTYVYNLKNAKKANVTPTGNGYGVGEGFANAILVGENNSLNDLFKITNNGLYIKELDGLHAGLDPISGDFSLKAEGKLIENGEITRPIKLITISGNVYKLFNNVKAIGNDYEELKYSNVKCPSIIVENVSVSGI